MNTGHRNIFHKSLLCALWGFVCGVLLASITPISYSIFLWIALGLFLVWFFSERIIFIWVTLICLCISLGIVRFDSARPISASFSSGDSVLLSGVAREVSKRENNTQFILPQEGFNILIRTRDDVSYGDEVTVSGTVEAPENFETNQGIEFDYVSCLYKDKVTFILADAHSTVLSHGKGNPLYQVLIHVRETLVASFRRIFHGESAELLSGITLGVRQSLSPEFRDALVTTGTIHIVALSGYNVSIIARWLGDIAVRTLGLGAVFGTTVGGVGVVLFVCMTGLQSSAVRAGIMAILSMIALSSGRTYSVLRALCIAGAVMVLWNPRILVFDVSFQLSFLATLGIILLVPVLQLKCVWIPQKIFWIIPLRELVVVTLSAQIAVLPLLLYRMGTLSLISLPVNILILPVIPLAMAGGTIAGFLGIFSSVLAYPVAFISTQLLEYIGMIVRFLSTVPYGSFTMPISLGVCILLYGVLCVWVYTADTWRS